MTAAEYYIGNTDPVQEIVRGFKVRVVTDNHPEMVNFENTHFRRKLYGKICDSQLQTVVVPKGRCTGFTTGMAAYYVAMAAAQPIGTDIVFVYVAPNGRMCEHFMEKVREFVTQIPVETWRSLYPHQPLFDSAEEYMTISNGKMLRLYNSAKIVTACTIQALNRVVAGENVRHILIDEGDLLCNMSLSDLYGFCRTILAKQGTFNTSLIVSSTPMPKSKLLDMTRHMIDVPIKRKWYERLKTWLCGKKLPDHETRHLYPSMMLTWRDCPWYFGRGLWFEKSGHKLRVEGDDFDYRTFMDMCENGWQPHSEQIEKYREAWPKEEDNFLQLEAGMDFDEWLKQV